MAYVNFSPFKEHSNYRSVVQNKRHNNRIFVKTNDGRYVGSGIDLVSDRSRAWFYQTTIIAFKDSEKFDGKVFLETQAGDVELTKKDFQEKVSKEYWQ
jgi:hypothetical protein